MILLLSALLMAGGGDTEGRRQSPLVRELAISAARLAQTKGLAARIDELAGVVARLNEALAAANQPPARMEDAVYYARLSLSLVEEGLAPRLREVTDDDAANDSRYSHAIDTAARTLELSRLLIDILPTDQRSRLRPQYDALSPRLPKLQTWMKERGDRHDKRSAPPDGTTPRRNEKSPGGRSEGSPY